MRVTVCQLTDEKQLFENDWRGLVEHTRQQNSELVLLPEFPFYPWFGLNAQFDSRTWQEAVTAHEIWIEKLSEVGSAHVLGTRPVTKPSGRHNQTFLWQAKTGLQDGHCKVYLPNEHPVYEASWYQPGPLEFIPMQAGTSLIGLLICSELWFSQHARQYGRQGVQLLTTPRKTGKESIPRWLAAGTTAAMVAGAYSLSSNSISTTGSPAGFGGGGWIINPQGELIAMTSERQPFVTATVDLSLADLAKTTYPHNIQEP